MDADAPTVQAAAREVLAIAAQDPNSQKRAANALVPILVQSLSDSTPRIREAGAQALGARSE